MTLKSIRWMLKPPSSMAFSLKKYIWFNNLDMRNQVNNTKCVAFCKPLMGSNKFLANGMKDSPHIFFQVGFIKSKVDQNVYIKHDHKFFVFLGLYVDDSILVSNNLDFSNLLKLNFHKLLRWSTMVNCIIVLAYSSVRTAINIWYTLIKTNTC
jgi:hypothetical protein